MIRNITTIRTVKSEAELKSLAAIFESLGFRPGGGWNTGGAQGALVEAPLGKLEFIHGGRNIDADIWIEVTDLDTVQSLLKKQKIKAGDVQETDWEARVLVVEPTRGAKFAFWQPVVQKADAIEGELNSEGMRFAIVVSRWNSFITERLLQGALDALRRTGCRKEDVTVMRVPGSFEIPSQSRTLAATGKYDAIITLGCLIRGETTHYEHIATEVTRGIGQSAQETGVPHTYGVLTCENLEQALDRAGLKSGNKGFEAAISAVEMVSLKRKTSAAASKSKR